MPSTLPYSCAGIGDNKRGASKVSCRCHATLIRTPHQSDYPIKHNNKGKCHYRQKHATIREGAITSTWLLTWGEISAHHPGSLSAHGGGGGPATGGLHGRAQGRTEHDSSTHFRRSWTILSRYRKVAPATLSVSEIFAGTFPSERSRAEAVFPSRVVSNTLQRLAVARMQSACSYHSSLAQVTCSLALPTGP